MTLAYSRRLSSIRPFYVMELLQAAQALERQGHDIVHLEIGEPDFPTPRAVVEAGRAMLEKGLVRYTSAAGLLELREAISGHYLRRYGLVVSPERIFLTPGASGALLLALAAVLDAGDRILLSDPGYPCYANFAALLGGQPVRVPVGGESRFQLNADRIVQHWDFRCKGAIVASPSNPTGTALDRMALARLVEAVEGLDGRLISDEIYHGLEYGEPSPSALEFSDQVLVINSFSKFFGMTGWRLGWLIAPEGWVRPLESLAQNLFIAAPAHSQSAALASFTEANLRELEGRRNEFQRRRDFLIPGLEALGFSVPARPDGAFYVYADCTAHTRDSFRFAQDLLREAHVAVTPGRDFGEYQPERYLRFAFTNSLERMSEGLHRLGRFLAA